jgi:hypothetical protein
MKERPSLEGEAAVEKCGKACEWWMLYGRESDHVAEEVLGDLTVAVAAESEGVATIGDRDYCDDRLREIFASIANQQISLGRGGGVDLPHLFRVAIDPTIDEVRGRALRYPY